MAIITSPSRRVLGDKTTNASVRQRASHDELKTNLDALTTREPVLSVKPTSEQRHRAGVTPKVGQKRRIEEVDGPEDPPQLGQETPRSTSSLSQTLGELDSDKSDGGKAQSKNQDKATTTTHLLVSSFRASQELPMQIEDQFEIQEEMSQQTLDQIHATPLPQHTSQLQPALRPNLETENSQESIRMSSFIDFDPIDPEGDLKMTSPTPTLPTEAKARKTSLDEKAETLRTRLQLALYKVQTNQISKPFSRLQKPRSSSPELPPRPPSLKRAVNPEGVIAAARARATKQRKPAVKRLSEMAVPRILPTAYSARYMPLGDQERDGAVPSWPPDESANLEQEEAGISTPRKQGVYPETPMQLSSPPRSESGELNVKDGQRYRILGLTSSVVKGEAANGLLELMRAAAAGGSARTTDVSE